MDQIGLTWTEYVQSGQNGPNRTKVDRIRPKLTKLTK